jgi:hypothetical protein
MMGIPSREEKMAVNALRREAEREARRAEREVERAARRERRREIQRLAVQRWRATHPDEKREYDRRYRVENKERVLAASAMRKARAKARGYRWKPTTEYIERERAKNTAFRYLAKELGLVEWWGPRETYEARREAAYAYAKENGLIP